MIALTQIPAVLWLLAAPLTAALITLIGKLFPGRGPLLPAFLCWSGGTAWGLWQAAPAALSGASLLYAFGGWAEPAGIVIELNPVSWAAGLLVLLIGSAVWLSSHRSKDTGAVFFLIFYLGLFALQGVLCSRDLFNLFIWFELLSLSVFLLVGYDQTPAAMLAAFRYLLISTVSILGFLVGLWILYAFCGAPSFSVIQSCLASVSNGVLAEGTRPLLPVVPKLRTTAAVILIMTGMLTRSAIVPFHGWLPPAHSSAPYPASAFLSGFVIKVPVLALWHFSVSLPELPLTGLLLWIGIVSAVFGSTAAVVQKDAKRILAYSSIGHMGFIMSAFAVAGPQGKTAALLYIAMHGLSKALLFLTVGLATSESGTRDVYELRGAGRRFPAAALCFWIAGLTLMGIPFSGGYYAKVAVTSTLSSPAASWILTAAGAATDLAIFKIALIFLGRSTATGRMKSQPQAPFTARFASLLAMGLLAAACTAMALFPERILSLTEQLSGNVSAANGSVSSSFLIAAGKSSNLWKTTAAFLIGLSGLFIFRFEPVKTFSEKISDLRLGTDATIRMLIIGILIFLVSGALRL